MELVAPEAVVEEVDSVNHTLVVKVDRVAYGPLTKKDLPRGHWRHLTREELNLLRMTT